MEKAEILTAIKEEISNDDYEKYIKQLKIDEKSSDENFLIFNTNNNLMAKFISTKFKDIIQKFYEKKTGHKISVIISTSKNNEVKNITKTQSNKPVSTILNNSYSFENFVVGKSNQFAYTSSLTIAQNPGERYNPLFIYGPSGLGKTHLLQSIGNYCILNNKSVICVTSEQFINDFTYNIKNKSMENFKQKYRNCDLLLIDDMQFLANTENTQIEFFHTFNELINKKSQIVMTSDKPPKNLNGFEERLISRFESGLTIGIEPPDLDIKIAIIKKKSKNNKIILLDEIINYIAINMGDNMRDIESAINKLNAFSRVMKINITLDIAKDLLKDQIKENNDKISLEKIMKIISKELNTKPSEITGKSRSKSIVKARRIAIYLSKDLTQSSMPAIAKFFGMKDHSSISHNIKKLNEMLKGDDYLKIEVEELRKKILKSKV